jgi:hypothetical protein
MIDEVEARIEDAVGEALQAFWLAVAEKFPEVTTGDYDPMLEGIMYAEAEEWVGEWLRMNAIEKLADEVVS